MKNKIMIIQYFIVGLLLATACSCKKDSSSPKKEPIITWDDPADIYYETLLSETQLNATADVSGIFVYTPALGTKLDVGINQVLKVDFTPSDLSTYKAMSKTVKINVNAKKNPIITWVTPSCISTETSLCSTQLNATANVPGTFVYTPAIGTKLSAGVNQDLKVDFTPTDAVTYNTISKTVKINVFVFGSVTDYDGNVYKTITIGTQTWMAENLKSTHYADGTSIPDVVSYNNTDDNAAKYGRLYTWDAAMNGVTTEKAQGVSPTGWHIPSNSEWQTMDDYLGGSSVAGGKLKAITDWNSPNTGATNLSGFSALPGGEYDAHQFIIFQQMGTSAVFWTSTNISSTLARERYLLYNDAKSSIYDWYKIMKYSIRCIKD